MILGAPAFSQARSQCAGQGLAAELFTGGAWNVPLPLTVRVARERASFTARYETRPFRDAPYYSYRVGRTTVGGRVEAEMLHQRDCRCG